MHVPHPSGKFGGFGGHLPPLSTLLEDVTKVYSLIYKTPTIHIGKLSDILHIQFQEYNQCLFQSSVSFLLIPRCFAYNYQKYCELNSYKKTTKHHQKAMIDQNTSDEFLTFLIIHRLY